MDSNHDLDDDDDDESKEINSGLAPRKFEGHGHWWHFRSIGTFAGQSKL